jgi:hypothetical protein
MLVYVVSDLSFSGSGMEKIVYGRLDICRGYPWFIGLQLGMTDGGQNPHRQGVVGEVMHGRALAGVYDVSFPGEADEGDVSLHPVQGWHGNLQKTLGLF